MKKIKAENKKGTKVKKIKNKKSKKLNNNKSNKSNLKTKLKKNNKSSKSQLNKANKNLIKTSKLNDIIVLLKKNKAIRKPYFIYVIECEGEKLYTGITTDIKRRFEEHKDTSKSRKGAKFTKLNKPIRIKKYFKVKNRSIATSLEHKIKKLAKIDKLKLCNIGDI